jgi:hypothetical protein
LIGNPEWCSMLRTWACPLFAGDGMNRILMLAATIVVMSLSSRVNAATSIETTSTCLTDSTSGRDRKEFVKWVYLAMSQHPEIKDLVGVTPELTEESNQNIGQLMTRLLTEDCPNEVRDMIKENGPSSMSKAFEVLGRVAMMELMSDPSVSSAMSKLDQYTDQERIRDALSVQ